MFEETHNAPAQPVFSSLKILFRDDAVTVVVVVFLSSLFSFQRATKFYGHMTMATGSTRVSRQGICKKVARGSNCCGSSSCFSQYAVFSIEVAGDLKITGENIRFLDLNDNPLIMGNHIYCALYCGL